MGRVALADIFLADFWWRKMIPKLTGGFKNSLFPLYLAKSSNLTNIFQMG